jgi:hypothetical protein
VPYIYKDGFEYRAVLSPEEIMQRRWTIEWYDAGPKDYRRWIAVEGVLTDNDKSFGQPYYIIKEDLGSFTEHIVGLHNDWLERIGKHLHV